MVKISNGVKSGIARSDEQENVVPGTKKSSGGSVGMIIGIIVAICIICCCCLSCAYFMGDKSDAGFKDIMWSCLSVAWLIKLFD